MPKITVNANRCKGCFLCIRVCPKKLLEAEKQLNTQGVNPVRFKKNGECIGCAMCAVICPDCCISVYK